MIHLADGRKLLFTPDNDYVQAALEALITGAKQSVHMICYAFTLPTVSDALIAKHLAGLDVRLVLDKSQAEPSSPVARAMAAAELAAGGAAEPAQVLRLKAAGVPLVIGTSSAGNLIHEKAGIVDGALCWYGSWNVSFSASLQANHFVVDPTPEVVQAFEAEFENNWLRLGGLPDKA